MNRAGALVCAICAVHGTAALGQSIESISAETRNTVTKVETLEVDNCEGPGPQHYQLEQKVGFKQTLQVDEGWAIRPGLSVSVPKIGDVQLGAELTRRYGSTASTESQTTQQFGFDIPAGTFLEFRVPIVETTVTGTVTIVDRSLVFKTRATSRFTFVAQGGIAGRVEQVNRGCLAGHWELLSWNATQERGGLGYVHFYPAQGTIGGGMLSAEPGGRVAWWVSAATPNGPTIRLVCEGLLNERARQIAWAHTTFDYGGASYQLPAGWNEELSFAVCGSGLSPATGQYRRSNFAYEFQPGPARVLVMTNSESIFRWRRR